MKNSTGRIAMYQDVPQVEDEEQPHKDPTSHFPREEDHDHDHDRDEEGQEDVVFGRRRERSVGMSQNPYFPTKVPVTKKGFFFMGCIVVMMIFLLILSSSLYTNTNPSTTSPITNTTSSTIHGDSDSHPIPSSSSSSSTSSTVNGDPKAGTDKTKNGYGESGTSTHGSSSSSSSSSSSTTQSDGHSKTNGGSSTTTTGSHMGTTHSTPTLNFGASKNTTHDPFHLHTDSTAWYGGVFVEPPYPSSTQTQKDPYYDPPTTNHVGYIQYPNILNNTLVFCSEGNLYITTLPSQYTIQDDSSSSSSSSTSSDLPYLHAMRLTTTIGNVNTPKINPKYPFLVAFTATYTGRREVYLMDLRPEYRSQPSMRLTYLDSISGAAHVIGWEDDGTSIVFGSYSMDVSMDDYRLYKVYILSVATNLTTPITTLRQMSPSQQEQKPRYYQSKNLSPITVSSVKPIPLTQAIDSVVDSWYRNQHHDDENDPITHGSCRYFTRFTQSSNTVRYLGGTAESLWAYCDDELIAIALTSDYMGTSKAPQIYESTVQNEDGPSTTVTQKYLFFMSDRSDLDGQWIPTSMNLWVMPLPEKSELYADRNSNTYVTTKRPFAITSISCQFGGMHLREYSIDPVTGNVLLRIGADLYILSRHDVERKIAQSNTRFVKPTSVPIAVYSDFNNLHERMISINNPFDVSTVDVFTTIYGSVSTLMVARGQLFVNPVISDTKTKKAYSGGGMNMPPRRYRVAPGSYTGGMIRIFGSWYIPVPNDDGLAKVRKALVLATDPLSRTAEMAFYILDINAAAATAFASLDNLPKPLIGGHLQSGGSVTDGGLGSIKTESVQVSPCGRRVAWTDTDGRIVIMTLVIDEMPSILDVVVLPEVNDRKEPMVGIDVGLTWSPAGRYLAVEHAARNQFRVISIADLGDPSLGAIALNRIVQATPDRFNSMSPFWGRTTLDYQVHALKKELFGLDDELPPVATTLYFLSDRDVILTGNSSPWGSRAPGPSFSGSNLVYALPLVSKEDQMSVDPVPELYGGVFVGGGAEELLLEHASAWEEALLKIRSRKLSRNVSLNSRSTYLSSDTKKTSGVSPSEENESEGKIPSSGKKKMFPSDIPISFDAPDHANEFAFARRAYLMSHIPPSKYLSIMQLKDHPSLIVTEIDQTFKIPLLTIFPFSDFPEDGIEKLPILPDSIFIESFGISTDRQYLHVTYSGKTKIIPNTVAGVVDGFIDDLKEFTKQIVDTESWAISVWPKLEYQQMYSDAWRMLRDYYYDPTMSNVKWTEIHNRYVDLVDRCGRREELDDVLKQMASELSALHVFVYGGEYNDPLFGNELLRKLNEVSSLGAKMERSDDGFIVIDVPRLDPDFNPLDGKPSYSPLSDLTLRITGQHGLDKGDIIVAVNGESVKYTPDINMLLRGAAGRTVRLEVVRIKSVSTFAFATNKSISEHLPIVPEPVLVVPLSLEAVADMRYSAWEWKTRQMAKALASEAGFSVGYIHLRSMVGAEGEDAFVRSFFPDYDKEAMIIDVRHNHGGNIDSWLLASLQRKAWMYWQDRALNITNGGMGWDEQFAFRGHLVVLIDEKTSSDGEGFARGVSELALGKLVGTRTWGGGIWLSSDNRLVDGGIASAPEVGTYNKKWNWGLGIEQLGVTPDIVIDNNPRESFDGKDRQLEAAIEVLKKWLVEEPIVLPPSPGAHKDLSINKRAEGCTA